MLLTRSNAVFWLIWLLLLIFCYFNSYDDPSSIFYDAKRAYQQKFSRVRTQEADEHLRHLPPKPSPAADRLLCIGIPSVNRTTHSFLASTIATLTDTLTTDERATIHIVVLLANKSPKTHFAYGQKWLEDIADEVLLYDTLPTGAGVYHTIPFDLLDGHKRGDGRVENMRLDHSALVEACRRHGSQYFALVEDDIVASRDWFLGSRRDSPTSRSRRPPAAGTGYTSGCSTRRSSWAGTARNGSCTWRPSSWSTPWSSLPSW